MKEEILRMLAKSAVPMDAGTIHKNLRSKVNLSTVYRALDTMASDARLNVVFFFDGTRFYYPRDRHGHFLMCRKCHEVREFEQCAVRELQKRLEEKTHYKIENHSVLFSGLCPDCVRVESKREEHPYFKKEGS